MAIADPVSEQMWNAFPPSPAVSMTTERRSASVADPEAWRKDGTAAALAEQVAYLADYPGADKECMSVAGKILRETGGDIDGVNAALARLGQKDEQARESFFVRTARRSPPGWQIKYIVAECKRGAPKKPQGPFDDEYRKFVHGTTEHEAYRKVCPCDICDRADAAIAAEDAAELGRGAGNAEMAG